jgi:hypothetical protein
MKKLLSIIFLALLALLAFYLIRQFSTKDGITTDSTDIDESRIQSRQDSVHARKTKRLESSSEQAPNKLILVPDFNITQHVSNSAIQSYAKYVTPSSNMEIRSPDGRVLYNASPDNPFLGIKTIEGGKHVAINRGDGRYRLINVDTLDSVDLPSVPPVERPIGFSWNWFNPNTLVGVAGIGYADSAQPKGRCCDQHIVASSLLYLYNIENRSIEEVGLSPSLKGLVFDIGRTTQDGHIEIISASGHDDDGQSLGWFQIIPE